MKRNLKTGLKWIVVYPLLVFICLEIAFRIMGYGAFYNEDYSVKATPKNAYIGHPKLGIQLNPGTYKVVLNDKVKFKATHEEGNHRRVVGNDNPDTPDVLFLGCSFTYGYGVDDKDNFPSLIQAKFPRSNVRNGGVVGYGTVQSLMQLRDAVDRYPLKLVVLNFSSLHFMRNNLSQQYRSNLKIGYQRSSSNVDGLMAKARFPYKSSCDSKIQFQDWETMYSNWPGRSWFASINGLQSMYDDMSGGDDQIEITACIIQEMADLCSKHDIKFMVSCLDKTAETSKLHAQLKEVQWIDVHFDFKSKKHTNLPYDSHPNKKGHKRIAEYITPFLKLHLSDL